MASLIRVGQEPVEVKPAKKKFGLEELQKYVGGYIEYVSLPLGRKLVVNEEGRLAGLKPNPVASGLAGLLIVGDVVLLEKGEE